MIGPKRLELFEPTTCSILSRSAQTAPEIQLLRLAQALARLEAKAMISSQWPASSEEMGT